MTTHSGAGWRLHHGNALPLLLNEPDASVDAIITDPPYSSGGFTRGDRMGGTVNKYVVAATPGGAAALRPEFAGDNRDQRGYLAWCALWMAEALRIARPSASLLVFTDWRQLPTTTDAVQAGGWVWRGIVPWDKGEGVRPRRGGFSSQAEYVVWATSGPVNEAHEVYLPGVIKATVRQDDKHHITGKPTTLMERLVTIAPPGGTILDPFAGSGTTGVAALRHGRQFIGYELTDHYAAVTAERLRSEEDRPTMFAAGLTEAAELALD